MDRLNRIDLYLNYNERIEHIDIELEETYKTLEENKVYIKNLETIIDNENVEIERLNNIIKEFDEFLFGELQIYGGGGLVQEYYNKLQELKGSDKK